MKPITIILTDGYADWEIAPLIGAGRSFFGAEFRFVSPEGRPVTSAGGLPVAATDRFAPVDDGVVVVCGGAAWESDAPPRIEAALQQSLSQGTVIAGICGGTLALARAGLLDRVSHTSNGMDYLTQLAPAYAGSGRYVDQPQALRDGSIITAPAPAPASFAYEVLAAAGLDPAAARQLPQMLAREHQA